MRPLAGISTAPMPSPMVPPDDPRRAAANALQEVKQKSIR